MPEQHVPDQFEDRLRTLLARAAEAIPPDTDVFEHVRQAHARGTHRSRVAGSRPVLATIAAVLVVALLAGALTFARPGGPLRPPGVTGTPTTAATATAASPIVIVPPICDASGSNEPVFPVGPRVDHSVAISGQVSVHGITLTLDRAYADATQTVITYHIQPGANLPQPEYPLLLDAQGSRYANFYSSSGQGGGGIAIFAPLPPEQLGTPQMLTFFTQRMRSVPQQYQVPTPPAVTLVDGPWQIPFTITPVAGTSVALSNAPATHNGLTIQPLRLDVAPPGGDLDGASGGERVLLRLSGLAPGMHLSDAANVGQAFILAGTASSSCGGGTLALVLPDGQPILPGLVQPVGLIVATTDAEVQAQRAQTVGPSGTVDLEAVFYAPIPAGTSVTLYFDDVRAQVAGVHKSTSVQGPWQFQLPPTP
ncbi:MAG TPA: hypothetical protein VFU88_18255 [Ktedonobacterales bacterium]|nr:hypothetical protein [Ktedonobacterales bacterium]